MHCLNACLKKFWILDDEETMDRAKEIIVKVQGEMENLDAIVQEVKLKLESTNKQLEDRKGEKGTPGEPLSMRQKIRRHRYVEKTVKAKIDLVQPIEDASESKKRNWP